MSPSALGEAGGITGKNSVIGASPTPDVLNATNATAPYSLRRDRLVWLLLLIGLAVRVLYNLALHPNGHMPPTFVIDEREYFGAAHMLADGRGFSFYDSFVWVRPPLYVLLLGGVLRAWGGAYVYLSLLIVQALLSVLSLPPLGWLAARVGGRTAARWTVGLGALYLPFTLFAGLLLSETLFVLLFCWSLPALVQAREALAAGWSMRALSRLLAAGVLLGGATLTRATALAFLPVAMLWLAWGSYPARWRRMLAASVFAAAFVLTLLPWTVRNYVAYHSFVPVDTTGGYNLWLASVGVRDEPRLQADLLAIPNQADRQSYAYRQALETIAADPVAFVGKGLKESLDLWKPHLAAEENAAQGYPSGRVPTWHLLSLLFFDNGLYVIILVLTVAGMSLAPPGALKWLTAGWALVWVGMSFVFFAVTRFRLPVVAAFLPWAGVGATFLPSMPAWRSKPLLVRLGSLAALPAIVVVVALNVPLQDTLAGIQAWESQQPYREGETLLLLGDVDRAIASYKRADMGRADTRYSLAAAYLQKGQPQQALALLRADEPDSRFEPPVIKGEAARMRGDLNSARSFFNARVVQVAGDEALVWAWDHLRPAPVERLDVGSGLDVGYIKGFYGPEKDQAGETYRWSMDKAEIRGLMGPDCRIRWSGWRPAALSPAVVTLASAGVEQGGRQLLLENTPAWNSALLGLRHAGSFSVQMGTNAFIGSGLDPRLLGVRVAEVTQCGR